MKKATPADSSEVAIYLRVSKGTGQDTASQRPDLERWLDVLGGSARWFEDKLSGKSMDRPGWLKLMAEVRAGRVKTIAVWRLDRLGRTAKGLVDLFDELTRLRVNLVSLKDGLDLATPAGRLMANVLASVAAYETEVRAERIHAGLEVARAKGVRLGRAPGSGKGRRLKVTPEQSEVTRRLRAEGKGVSAIARSTGLSRPTIYSILGEV